MYHQPNYVTFEFIGHGPRETTRTNCKSCGKRIQWKGGQKEFFYGKNPERWDAENWNTKSDWWRRGKRIETKGCETIRS
jgi:hypothetical protein